MKLKCDLHGSRVVTGQKGFIHRNGNGGVCQSKTATIGDEKYTARGIIDRSLLDTSCLVCFGPAKEDVHQGNTVYCLDKNCNFMGQRPRTPEEQLLHDIFGARSE